MDKKTGIIIGLLIAVASGIPIFILGTLFNIIPSNKYVGVFWMIFIPMAIYYMQEERKRMSLVSMMASYLCGLGWGFVAILLSPLVQPLGGILVSFVNYFVVVVVIIFIHKGLLNGTPFDMLSCLFIGFAFSIAASTTYFWSGKVDMTTFQMVPTAEHFNQLDLFIIFALGCGMTWFVDTLTGLFIGAYLKKNSASLTTDVK